MKMPPLHELLGVPAELVEAVLDADDGEVDLHPAAGPAQQALAGVLPDGVTFDQVKVSSLSRRYGTVSLTATFRGPDDTGVTSPSWFSLTVEGDAEITGIAVEAAGGNPQVAQDVEAALRTDAPARLGRLLHTDPTVAALAARTDLIEARQGLLRCNARALLHLTGAAEYLFDGLAAVGTAAGGAPSTIARLAGDWHGTPAELVAAAGRLDREMAAGSAGTGTVTTTDPQERP